MTRSETQVAPRRKFALRLLHALPAGLYGFLKRVPVTRAVAQRVLDLSRLDDDFADTEILGGPLKGCTLSLQPRTHKEMVLGVYERHLEDTIKSVLERGHIAFDIGAHLGYYSLMMGHLVGPTGGVVAFEPNPEIMKVLTSNKERNTLDATIVPIECALGSFDGYGQFWQGSESLTGHLVTNDQGISVRVTTLDEAASVHGTPNFVKVDVEGSELDVLRGGQKLLQSQSTAFLIEAHSQELSERCERLLSRVDYRCRLLRQRGARTIHILAVPEHSRS